MTFLHDLFPGGKKYAVTMSYDDTSLELNEKLIGIFNKYGIKGTFHLNGCGLESQNPDIGHFREVYFGHEISCHTYSHPLIGKMPRESILEEILRDRLMLEKYAGYPVRGMSYPCGSIPEKYLDVLRACGIEYSRTNNKAGGLFTLPDDFLHWTATCHHSGGINNQLEKLLSDANGPRLLYIWGHAHEFPRTAVTFETIENFCRAAAEHSDKIWFATNIEIKDYVDAQHSVRYSLDGSAAYNPSCISVWATRGGKAVEIKPGMNEFEN